MAAKCAKWIWGLSFGSLITLLMLSALLLQARAAAEPSEPVAIPGPPLAVSGAVFSDHVVEMLDRMTPQEQAEALLQRTINHYQGASDLLAGRVEGWQGSLEATPSLETKIEIALDSNDLRVRAAGIEVWLALHNIAKTPDSVNEHIQAAEGGGANRAFALYVLGFLGGRGIEVPRLSRTLLAFLNEPDPEVRAQAVQALAWLGVDGAVEPLLRSFLQDPSMRVREVAGAHLAQFGLLSRQQRLQVVPALLKALENPSLDSTTRNWVYHALRDITGQRLPPNPDRWQNWHSTTPIAKLDVAQPQPAKKKANLLLRLMRFLSGRSKG